VDWGVDLMEWPALNDRLCGILIDFSLEEGLVLFLKERVKRKEINKREQKDKRARITEIMKVGNYLSLYLPREAGNSENTHIPLLGRLKDIYWKSEKALREEYNVPLGEWQKKIASKSASVIEGTGKDTLSINVLGSLHALGKIEFLGVPKEIPLTWTKVFEANEAEVRSVLGLTEEDTGFKARIGPRQSVPVGFRKKDLTDNILIIGSRKDFLCSVFKEILGLSTLPRIVFTERAATEFSDFDRISVQEFRELISNGFGFECCSDEQILNAATSLNPPQIRLLSNLLNRSKKEKANGSKLRMLKEIIKIERNSTNQDSRYLDDLKEIENFLEMRDRNLNRLMEENAISVVDIAEKESRQILFSKFIHAVIEEIDNRKRMNSAPLEFLFFLESVEDYVPSYLNGRSGSETAISKESFSMLVSHPETERIGLIMCSRFPSRVDPLVNYLCPCRIFGEVFERRELLKIEEIFGINEMEIKRLTENSSMKNVYRILFNFPSRFSVEAVDGILDQKRRY
jgi:hypothetical protein